MLRLDDARAMNDSTCGVPATSGTFDCSSCTYQSCEDVVTSALNDAAPAPGLDVSDEKDADSRATNLRAASWSATHRRQCRSHRSG